MVLFWAAQVIFDSKVIAEAEIIPTSTFGRANTWVRFNTLPEGDGVKVQFFRS